jgi:predicted ATP-dependent serine protease
MSSTVESEVDIVRMRKDELQYKDVLELLNTMKVTNEEDLNRVTYNNIPFAENPRFSCREDVLKDLNQYLGAEVDASSLRSMALFGMGGVGKTQIAIQYAYRNLDKFDIVLWIAADNSLSVGQSFRSIAEGLGLLETDEELRDSAGAMYKVKTWLATKSTRTPFIYFIFENVSNSSRTFFFNDFRQRG